MAAAGFEHSTSKERGQSNENNTFQIIIDILIAGLEKANSGGPANAVNAM